MIDRHLNKFPHLPGYWNNGHWNCIPDAPEGPKNPKQASAAAENDTADSESGTDYEDGDKTASEENSAEKEISDVDSESTTADIKKAKAILEEILHNDEDTKDDQGMVVFVDELGESAVVMGLRVWVATEKYWPARWRLNELIKEAFDANGIEIPDRKSVV